jgi:NhaB family Na+:H+ antiporter
VAAIIEETQLFRAMVYAVLDLHGKAQYASLFCIVGLLSTMSDNVFVAAVYINEVFHAYETDHISAAELNLLAVAINVATNVPSLATPNGQAAFLYLYTSPLAPLVRLSYFKMVWMALPYTITLSIISLIITVYIREFTESMVAFGWLPYV